MDMNRSPNAMYGSDDLHVPSGLEVESASLHMPVEGGVTATPAEPRTWKDNWKEKVTALPARVKPIVSNVSTKVSGTMQTASTRVSSTMRNTSTRLNGTMRDNPTKWAGIAAGAGLGIGLIGRYLHHRTHHVNKGIPAIVIIDAAC